jgi:hypothetical protein
VTLSLLVPGVGWATMVVMLLLFYALGNFPMVAFITKTEKKYLVKFSFASKR